MATIVGATEMMMLVMRLLDCNCWLNLNAKIVSAHNCALGLCVNEELCSLQSTTTHFENKIQCGVIEYNE